PTRLSAFGMSLSQVSDAVRGSNADVGGRVLEMGGSEIVVRSRGRFANMDDIRAGSLGTGAGGSPITLRDVATVHTGPELRRGISDLNGRGEVVLGWFCMRHGENTLS